MPDSIDYGNLMHDAMRGLIQQVLEGVAANGLPGEHHFFITFDTRHDDVVIADWLADRYPEDMTIVVQHWFDNLLITDVGFSITLNFGDNPEPLYIPFDALVTFVDPSVEFGLRFENQDDDDDGETSPIKEVSLAPETSAKPDEKTESLKDHADAEVVSLDSFRK